LISRRARLALGRGLGRLVFLVDRRHRQVALENLGMAFPAADPSWRAGIARRSFENLGRLLVEVLMQKHDRQAVIAETEIEGWEHVEGYARSGTGFFVMSGHFGNWEQAAFVQAARGRPLVMVARPLDNPYLESLLAEVRQATGNRLVHKRSAIRETVKALRDGNPVAFVIDQDFPEAEPHFVPYFGKLASTTPALGSIVARMGVPVVPVFAYPRPGGGYRVVYGPPLEAGGDAVAITAAATKRIEEAVRACPEAWFWMHDRWRTRPLDEPI
jgi:Kdo2-lipid IVA lauroyltransferase/acyltransferase